MLLFKLVFDLLYTAKGFLCKFCSFLGGSVS